MSNLLSRLTTPPLPKPCKLARILSILPDDLGPDVEKAVSEPIHYNATAIAAELRALNYFVSDRVIQRHRRGECGCG